MHTNYAISDLQWKIKCELQKNEHQITFSIFLKNKIKINNKWIISYHRSNLIQKNIKFHLHNYIIDRIHLFILCFFKLI